MSSSCITTVMKQTQTLHRQLLVLVLVLLVLLVAGTTTGLHHRPGSWPWLAPGVVANQGPRGAGRGRGQRASRHFPVNRAAQWWHSRHGRCQRSQQAHRRLTVQQESGPVPRGRRRGGRNLEEPHHPSAEAPGPESARPVPGPDSILYEKVKLKGISW